MWRMYKTTMEWYDKKKELLKELDLLVESLKTIDNEPRYFIFVVCKEFLINLTY